MDVSESPPRGPDRRRQPTSPWAALRPGGRRKRNRRQEDCRTPYYVDRFENHLLAWILILLTFSIADGVMTLLLIEGGFAEANPAMRFLLDRGAMWFLIGKYTLTAGGLPVLLVFKNHGLFHRRLRVGALIPLFVVLYAALLAYQIGLLWTLPEARPDPAYFMSVTEPVR
jgi:hypothetical protein